MILCRGFLTCANIFVCTHQRSVGIRTFWCICHQFHHSQHCGGVVYHLDNEKFVDERRTLACQVASLPLIFSGVNGSVVCHVLGRRIVSRPVQYDLYEPFLQKRMFSMLSSVSLLQLSVNVRLNKSSSCFFFKTPCRDVHGGCVCDVKDQQWKRTRQKREPKHACN